MKQFNIKIRQTIARLVFVGSAFMLSGLIGLSGRAMAASTFGDHLWKFANGSMTNKIDFNKGGSKIYDNGSLHVATDGTMYLDAPKTVVVKNNMSVAGTLNLNDASSLYNGNANVNCDEACVDLTPADAGTTNAIWELQGDGGEEPESTGIAMNSDTINMWSPGDDAILKVFDEDDFCDACTLGRVGDDTEGVVAAMFEVDGNGGVNANGDSHFYGDLTVDGSLTADLSAFVDNDLSGVTGNFEIGTEEGGDLTVYGDTYTDDLIADGDLFVGNDCTGCVLELNDYGYVQFDYDGGNWQQYVDEFDNFNIYNDDTGNNVLTIEPYGDASFYDDLDVGDDLYVSDGLTVDGESDFNNDVYVNDSTLSLDYSTLQFWYGENPDYWNLYANSDSGDLVLYNGNTDYDVLTIAEDGATTFQASNYEYNAFQILDPDGYRMFNVNTDSDYRVSVGHWDNNVNFKVWGDTYQEGDLDLNGDLYNDDGEVVISDDLTIDSGNWDWNAFQVINPDGERVFNINTDYNRVSVGHWDTNTELKVWGDSTLRGDIEVDDYSYFYDGLEADGLDVYDYLDLWEGADLSINDGGDLYVDGTATVNDLVINNSMSFSGTVSYSGNTTYNGNATFNGNLTAGATTLTGALVGTSATFNNTLTANAGVNFSAASMLRVPNSGLNLADGADGNDTCASGNKGDLQLDTGNSLFVCDGTDWQQLDN